MFLPQNDTLGAPPSSVEFTEAAVQIAVRMLFAIFLPEQLQSYVFARLQLSVNEREIRLWTLRPGGYRLGQNPAVEQLLQPVFIAAFRQRPANTGRLRSFQVTMHGCLADRTTPGDLALSQTQTEPQP